MFDNILQLVLFIPFHPPWLPVIYSRTGSFGTFSQQYTRRKCSIPSLFCLRRYPQYILTIVNTIILFSKLLKWPTCKLKWTRQVISIRWYLSNILYSQSPGAEMCQLHNIYLDRSSDQLSNGKGSMGVPVVSARQMHYWILGPF